MFPLANVLQPLIDFFEAILQFFHDTVGLGWGMSIVALTIVVRAALLPLTLKQFRSMQNLARHMPELKKLQDKYKNDRERLNQETMKFYRENKVNPLGSCLPLLAQMPVFLGLFYMLQKDLKLDICGPELSARGITGGEVSDAHCGDVIAGSGPHEFLFITDLTDKATGGVLATLIVLYIGSQLVSSVLMSVNQDRNQRMIMIALPFLFTLFIINFPTGLIVYWITTNLWTIVQQAIVRKRLGPLRPPEMDTGGGGGGLLATLRGGGAPTPATAAVGGGGGSGGKGGGKGGGGARKEPEKVGVSSGGAKPKPARSGPPPPSPRKKKKRSGRRR